MGSLETTVGSMYIRLDFENRAPTNMRMINIPKDAGEFYLDTNWPQSHEDGTHCSPSPPLYDLTNRENHGQGYHAHILVRNGRKYQRAGYIVTIKDDMVYLVPHAQSGETRVELTESNKGLIKCIGEAVKKMKKGIPEKDFIEPAAGALPLFKIE